MVSAERSAEIPDGEGNQENGRGNVLCLCLRGRINIHNGSSIDKSLEPLAVVEVLAVRPGGKCVIPIVRSVIR